MEFKMPRWLFALIFIGLGALVIFLSINTIKSDLAFASNAVFTYGRVESVTQKNNTDEESVKYIVEVSYDVDGKEYTGEYITSTYVSYGSTVNIYYDQYSPTIMRTKGFDYGGIIIFIIGIALAVFGIFVLFKREDDFINNGKSILNKMKEMEKNKDTKNI